MLLYLLLILSEMMHHRWVDLLAFQLRIYSLNEIVANLLDLLSDSL